MCVTSPELLSEVKICNIRTWTSKRKVHVEYPYLSVIKKFLPRLSFDQYRVWKRGSGVLIPHPELLSSHPESRIRVFFRTTYHAKTLARLAAQAIVKSPIPSRNFVFSQDPRFNCVKSRTENTLLDHVDMEQLQPVKLAESKRDFVIPGPSCSKAAWWNHYSVDKY